MRHHPCDLCHASDASRRYPTRPAYDDWFACAECSEFIEAADPQGLLLRALDLCDGPGRAAIDIRWTHHSFWFTLDLRAALRSFCETVQSS